MKTYYLQESPPAGTPVLARGGVPQSWLGGGGTPVLARGYPLSWGTPGAGLGYPPARTGVPPPPQPGLRYPQKGPEMRDLERTWDWGIPRVWTDKQTENITFPNPSDAGGNKCLQQITKDFRTIPVND